MVAGVPRPGAHAASGGGRGLLAFAAYVLFLVARAVLALVAAYAVFRRLAKGWG